MGLRTAVASLVPVVLMTGSSHRVHAQGGAATWDFEAGDLRGWTRTGTAFDGQPLTGDVFLAAQIHPVPLGGDYWDVPYPIGHQGRRWIGTAGVSAKEDRSTGTLTSSSFPIATRFITFLVSGRGDAAGLRVELQVQADGRSAAVAAEEEYHTVKTATGHDSEIMRREVWDVSPFLRRTGRIRIVDEAVGPPGHLNVDDFRHTDTDPSPSLVPIAVNEVVVRRDLEAPLHGIADLHAHLMAHEAFGGRLFHGASWHPRGIGGALADCADAHGGLSVTPEMGHSSQGYPAFDGWPRFTTSVHQQAHETWIKRAYEGGLRLVSLLAVNNELIPHGYGKTAQNRYPLDDKSAIDRQIAAAKGLARRNAAWMEIAYTPADARRIIQQDKLALVLGIEVDSLGNWKKPDDLPADPARARALIRAELERLHQAGVRQITPIHLADNAFGGCAIYHRLFDALTTFLSGRHYAVADGWSQGVRYRLDEDPGREGLEGFFARWLAYGDLLEQEDPSWRGKRSHVNAKGLNANGRAVLEEMMRLGMVIDSDHLSYRSLDEALTMAEARDYPVVASHTRFAAHGFTAGAPFTHGQARAYGTADIHRVTNEYCRTPQQVERILRLGGIVAPLLNQGDLRASEKRPVYDTAGSSKSWAQAYMYARRLGGERGVGIGSDINGLAELPGPRFGPFSAYAVEGDDIRKSHRRGMADRQANGVRYSTPIADYRAHRWADYAVLKEITLYDREQSRIWQAIALALGRASIDQADLRDVPGEIRLPTDTDFVKNIAKGMRAQSASRLPRMPFIVTVLSGEAQQHGAFYAKTGRLPRPYAGGLIKHPVAVFYEKVRPIWVAYRKMSGNNPPLTRSVAGHRDFDINVDGMAHYGMLPDFLQDLKNIGLTRADLAPLFRSAEDYVRMWEKCERRRPR